jgi:hypothetical protein
MTHEHKEREYEECCEKCGEYIVDCDCEEEDGMED